MKQNSTKDLPVSPPQSSKDIQKAEILKILKPITNQRHRIFLLHYAKTNNGRQSALAAGFGETNAGHWRSAIFTQNPIYPKIIADIQDVLLIESEASVQWCLDFLQNVAVSGEKESNKVTAAGKILDHLDKMRVSGSPFEGLSKEEYLEKIVEKVNVSFTRSRVKKVKEEDETPPLTAGVHQRRVKNED